MTTPQQSRVDTTPESLDDYVQRLIAGFPPLTEHQRTRIAELLRPVRNHPPARKTSDGTENDRTQPVATPPRGGDR